MTFKKGHPKAHGRKKGTPNKTTVLVKEALLAAFEELGGVEYLIKVGEKEPRAFLTLLARLVPNEIHAELHRETLLIVRSYTGIEWEAAAQKKAEVIKGPPVRPARLN